MTHPTHMSAEELTSSRGLHQAEATRLTLTLAGAEFAIEAASPVIAQGLLEHYGPYIKAGPGHQEPVVTIHVEQKPDPERVESWEPSQPVLDLNAMGIGPQPLDGRIDLIRDDAYGFTMDVPYVHGHYDGAARAELTIFNDMIFGGFEQVFVSLFISAMLPRDCILLHASGVLHEGQAWLFSGPSNAGKSTIVENSPGRTILSDEMVAITYQPETGQLLAHGTPFYGTWGQLGAPVAAPLHSIQFLHQSEQHQLTCLSYGERFRRACQVICSIRPNNALITEQGLHWAERLVPQTRLFSFAPSPSLWDYLVQPDHSHICL